MKLEHARTHSHTQASACTRTITEAQARTLTFCSIATATATSTGMRAYQTHVRTCMLAETFRRAHLHHNITAKLQKITTIQTYAPHIPRGAGPTNRVQEPWDPVLGPRNLGTRSWAPGTRGPGPEPNTLYVGTGPQEPKSRAYERQL